MNWWLFVAGLTATFTTVGHFTIGRKLYLLPMLGAAFDEISRKIMHAVFHYVSVFLVFSAAALLAGAFGVSLGGEAVLLHRFIALSYLFFAIVLWSLALSSGIKRAPLKMFQWVFFLIVAVTAWTGA